MVRGSRDGHQDANVRPALDYRFARDQRRVYSHTQALPVIIRSMSISPSISACVICNNGAPLIRRCLDSLAWCDDIVVVDSGSTDGTPDIARNHLPGKVRVIRHDWPGFNPQRQFAVSQCRHEWVLMLDMDEECSDELRQEIFALAEAQLDGRALFRMPRKNFIARRYVRCWSPDYQTRFVHRDRVEWDPRSLPEIRKAKESFSEGAFRGSILHNRLSPYRPTDFNEGVRQALYAEELAENMKKRGKRAGWLNLLFRPSMTFLKYYVLRGSFLDGRFGLVVAYKTTIGVMLKYSVLYGKELQDVNDEQ